MYEIVQFNDGKYGIRRKADARFKDFKSGTYWWKIDQYPGDIRLNSYKEALVEFSYLGGGGFKVVTEEDTKPPQQDKIEPRKTLIQVLKDLLAKVKDLLPKMKVKKMRLVKFSNGTYGIQKGNTYLDFQSNSFWWTIDQYPQDIKTTKENAIRFYRIFGGKDTEIRDLATWKPWYKFNLPKFTLPKFRIK